MSALGGLAAGFAQGFQQEQRIGLEQRRLKFEQKLQEQQQDLQQQEFGLRQDEASRQKAKDALGYVQTKKDQLSRQLFQTLQTQDVSQLPALRQRMGDLQEIEREAARHLVGQDLQDHVNDVQTDIGDLESGKTKWSQLTPERATNVFAHLGQGNPSDFIDTPNRPSPIGKKLQAWDAGVQNLPKDRGASLIQAGNDLFKSQFDGLIGQPASDGSTITEVNLAPPVPHPGDPANLVPTLHIKTQMGGKTGEQVIPLMVDHGQLLAAPDQKSQSAVRTLHLDDIFNHVGALQALHSAVNSDPAIQDKLMQGFIDGHEDKAAAFTDMMHMLGHNPNDYVPKQQLVQLPDGSFKLLAPNIDYKESHDYSMLAEARLLAANASGLRAETAKDKEARGPAAKGNTPVGTTVIGGKTYGIVFNKDTGEFDTKEIQGVQGPIEKPGQKPNLVDEVDPKTGKKTGRKLQVQVDASGNVTTTPVKDKGDKPSGNAAVNASRTEFGY